MKRMIGAVFFVIGGLTTLGNIVMAISQAKKKPPDARWHRSSPLPLEIPFVMLPVIWPGKNTPLLPVF